MMFEKCILFFVLLQFATFLLGKSKNEGNWDWDSMSERTNGRCHRILDETLKYTKEEAKSLEKKMVYAGFGHKLVYAMDHYLLTGKLITSDDQLNGLCERVKFNEETNSLTIHGFGDKKYIIKCRNDSCQRNKLFTKKNLKTYKERKFDDFAFKEFQQKWVWTDGKNYILWIICQGDKDMWILSSTEKKIELETKNFVLDKIKELGFNETNAFELSNELC